MNERTGMILEFLFTLDKAKTILRKGYLGNGSRRESIAEHMWHLALWAMLLRDEIGFKADLLRTLELVLTHDLVEIYAGDTYAFDEAAVAGQRAREEEAAEALFSSLPNDLAGKFRGLWDEFEEARTPEDVYKRQFHPWEFRSLNGEDPGHPSPHVAEPDEEDPHLQSPRSLPPAISLTASSSLLTSSEVL